MGGPAIVNPTAGAWKIRILDQAFWCGWQLCSVPNESWAAGGPVQGATWARGLCGWFVCLGYLGPADEVQVVWLARGLLSPEESVPGHFHVMSTELCERPSHACATPLGEAGLQSKLVGVS